MSLKPTVAVAVICKTPKSGTSKTRLSPPFTPDECAAISTCFIRDLTTTIGELAAQGGVTGYAVYTPIGTEDALRALLPDGFRLVPQSDGDLGARLRNGIANILKRGHAGAILVNSDSPTLPVSILRAAVDAVKSGDTVVLSPAIDGGYTLVGLSKPHDEIFTGMPWSTPEVYDLTLARAKKAGIAVTAVPGWYDVDDEKSLAMLQSEMAGRPVIIGGNGTMGAPAHATREFLKQRALHGAMTSA